MPRVNTDPVFTSLGWTSECRGVRRTSSKVRTTSFLTRGNPCSLAADPLMRESPLPAFAGEAGLLDCRVVGAIAKCMALCGLRPEVPRRGVRYSDNRAGGGKPDFQEVSRHGHGNSTNGAE